MKATLEDQMKLLELHGMDQRIAALKHKRAKHPAHAHLEELKERYQDLQRAVIQQGAVISDTQRELTKVEDKAEQVRTRRDKQNARLENNEVPLRDVSAMQHEIARMEQLLEELDEQQLEIMGRLESAQEARDSMQAGIGAIGDDVEATKAQFATDVEDLEQELRDVAQARENLHASLPAGLVQEYERAWARNGALAILEVRDGRVVGGVSDLSPTELDAIRRAPADQLYWTEDDNQIVIRTTSA